MEAIAEANLNISGLNISPKKVYHKDEIDLENLPLDYDPKGEKLKSHGNRYQQKLITFYFFKLLNVEENEPFRVACEMSLADKFDDLVLQCIQEDEINLRLGQLKHCANTDKKLTNKDLFVEGDTFYLGMYLKSFEKIMQGNIEEELKGNVEDIRLYTNIDIQFDNIMKEEMFDISYEDEYIFYKFSKTNRDKNIQKLVNKIKNKKVNKLFISNGKLKDIADSFFDKFKIFACCTDDSIENKTKDEIKKYFKIESSEYIECINNVIGNKVLDWINHPKGTFINKSELLDWMNEIKDKNKLSLFHEFNEIYLDKIYSSYQISFLEDDSTLYQKILKKNSFLFNIIAYCGIESSIKKFIQYHPYDTVKIIKDKEFIAYEIKDLLDDCRLNNCQFLIIACYNENICQKLREFVNFIYENKSLISHEKFIVVTEDKIDFQYRNVDIIEDHIYFEDLSVECQEKIMNTEITFLDCQIQLSDLNFIGIQEIINDKFLCKLIKSPQEIEICKGYLNQNTLDDLYCDQHLIHYCEIGKEIFKEQYPNDIFVVSSKNSDEFKQSILKYSLKHNLIIIDKKIFLIESEEDFLEKCAEHDKCNVTWIEYVHGKYFWKRTHGSIENVRKFLNKKVSNNINIDTLIATDEVVLISAAPGMGKSTFLSFLLTQFERLKFEIWPVKIDLIDYEEEFRNETFDIENPKEFIIKTRQFENEFDKILFEKYFNKRKVLVLIDGFDEITPYYREYAMKFILKLKETNTCKIIITTRFQEEKYLENQLNTLSYTLLPFNEKNIRDFFVKFWKNKTKGTDYSLSESDIKKITKLNTNSVFGGDKIFFKTPIHCRIFAEIYELKIQNDTMIADGINNLSKIINVTQLYEHFIEKKWNVYVDKYFKTKDASVEVRSMLDKRKDDVIKNHKLLSLCFIFDKEVLKKFLTESKLKKIDKLLKDFKQEKLDIGIIKRVAHNKPIFSHKTFAEYFVARWLHDCIEKKESAKDFFKSYLFERENEDIRRFFDLISVTDDNSMLKYIISNNQVLMEDEDVLLREEDKFGRNILHVCVTYSSEKIYKKFVEIGVNFELKDHLLDWSPLKYACNAKSWHNVNTLLTKSDEIVINLFGNKEKMLLFAAKHGYLEIVKHLFENINDDYKEKLIFARNKNNQTAFHIALQFRNLPVCNYLLKINKKIIHSYDKSKNYVLHYVIKYFSTNIRIFKQIVKLGASVNVVNIHGKTPLILAIENNYVKMCKFILNQKDVNVNLCGKSSLQTALHSSSRKSSNSKAIRELLIKAGAKIDARDITGKTPLLLAASKGNFEVCDYLIQQTTTDITIYDNRRYTVLHYIVIKTENSVPEIMKLAVNRGADVDALNEDGLTPLMLAMQRKKYFICDYLITEACANINIRKCKSNENYLDDNFREKVEKYLLILKYLIKDKFDIVKYKIEKSDSLPERLYEFLVINKKIIVSDNLKYNVFHFVVRGISKEILYIFIDFMDNGGVIQFIYKRNEDNYFFIALPDVITMSNFIKKEEKTEYYYFCKESNTIYTSDSVFEDFEFISNVIDETN